MKRKKNNIYNCWSYNYILYTLFIYNISKSGIQYQSKEMMNYIQMPLLFLFAVVNGYILLPFVFNTIEKIYNDNIEKNAFKKRILIVIVVAFILLIFEINYLRNTQEGILGMYMRRMNSQ